MGKFIVELAYEYCVGRNLRVPVTIDGSSVSWVKTGIPLTPYTEPDLEREKKTAHDDGYSAGYQAGREDLNRVMSDIDQAKKEAYEKGRKDVETQFCSYDACKNRQKEYLRGLDDAWAVARKIEFGTDDGGIPTNIIEEIFGTPIPNRVLRNFTASEAIAKIKEYEDRQAEFKVGDEVERILNGEVDSKAVFLEDDEGYYRCLFWTGCCFTTLSYPKEQFHKTGRHFDEFASVLEKMREGQDG